MQLQQHCGPIRRQFEDTLQRVNDLGYVAGDKTPWPSTVRTCRQILTVSPALWTLLAVPGPEPTNNAAVDADEVFSAGVRALWQAVIHSKLS
jgi:hypothetical protein